MDDFYTTVVQAAEEAVINALAANVEMISRDGPNLPHDGVVKAHRTDGAMAS